MRWMICRRLLEGAATGLGERTSEPHPEARTHANPAPSSRQGGRMESHWRLLLHAAPDVAVDRAANPSAAVPSNRQEGGEQGGSAQAELPLAEVAPPRQSRTVLQPLHWGDCGPGAAKAPATRASPDDPRGAATKPGPSPPLPPAPRPTQSPPTLALLVLTRLDSWRHRCPASFPSIAGAEEALPKPLQQSLVAAMGGGRPT